MKPSKDRLLELVAFVEPGSDDVTYTHAVFAQCFLPIRKLRNGGKRYEVRHGRAALLITAGDLLNPTTQAFVQMDVPSGSAARIALAHINNHIIRSKTVEEALVVPMGESLRDFMDYQSIAIGGKNGKEITRQIHNLAAARWHDTALAAAELAMTRWTRIVADMGLGGYQPYTAAGDLPQPEWPEQSFAELLKIAFGSFYIDRPDHPVIRRLQGLV